MREVKIEDKGCRGCSLCADICPVDVFEMNAASGLAKVLRQEDCIGCQSCQYACPSQCISTGGFEMLRPFHRIEENVSLIEGFLQAKTAQATLTQSDIEEALLDVGARLMALASAVTETMGRADRAVGRRAGMLAAAHLPEMYEESSLDGVLRRLQDRLRNSFDFDFETAGTSANLNFHPCGLHALVAGSGQPLGDAVLCRMFHEYWAGLLSKFTGLRYTCEVPQAGATCKMQLKPHE